MWFCVFESVSNCEHNLFVPWCTSYHWPISTPTRRAFVNLIDVVGWIWIRRTKVCFITSCTLWPHYSVVSRKRSRWYDLFVSSCFRCMLVCGGHSGYVKLSTMGATNHFITATTYTSYAYSAYFAYSAHFKFYLVHSYFNEELSQLLNGSGRCSLIAVDAQSKW